MQIRNHVGYWVAQAAQQPLYAQAQAWFGVQCTPNSNIITGFASDKQLCCGAAAVSLVPCVKASRHTQAVLGAEAQAS